MFALDRESLPQSSLNIDRKMRTNPFPWAGQFSPQLVEELLAAYAPRGAVVPDPFAGPVTTLVEAAGPRCGSELNPAAMILARVYRMPDEAARNAAFDRLRADFLEVAGEAAGPPFGELSNRAGLEIGLVGIWRGPPLGVARNLAAALVAPCDFHRERLDADTGPKNWTRLNHAARNPPLSPGPPVVHQADARSLPFEDGSVDLALTSPPYVRNYHQKFRRSVEALDRNVPTFARSEIGPPEPGEPVPDRRIPWIWRRRCARWRENRRPPDPGSRTRVFRAERAFLRWRTRRANRSSERRPRIGPAPGTRVPQPDTGSRSTRTSFAFLRERGFATRRRLWRTPGMSRNDSRAGSPIPGAGKGAPGRRRRHGFRGLGCAFSLLWLFG